MKTRIAVLLTGAMIAAVLILDYLVLNRTGLPVGWVIYLGLPITGAGVLVALRLADLGTGWDAQSELIAHSSPAPVHHTNAV